MRTRGRARDPACPEGGTAGVRAGPQWKGQSGDLDLNSNMAGRCDVCRAVAHSDVILRATYALSAASNEVRHGLPMSLIWHQT